MCQWPLFLKLEEQSFAISTSDHELSVLGGARASFCCAKLLQNQGRLTQPVNLKEAAKLKTSVVDVKVCDGEDRCYTIEVQVCREKFFIPRTVYYLAKLYSEQLLGDENYFGLRPATGISILDFDLFENCEEMHNIFEFRNQNSSLNLPETMTLHYIELSKFSRHKPRHLCSPFKKWLQILKF